MNLWDANQRENAVQPPTWALAALGLRNPGFFLKKIGVLKKFFFNHIIHHMPERVCVSGARKKIFFSIQSWAQS